MLTDGGNYVYYITGGSLEITNEYGTYSINGTLTSALGTNITISYTGAVDITDYTQSSSAPAKAIRVVNANNSNKGLKLNRRALRIRK